eukprot:2430166-Amphidinium_carterae.1
MAEITFSETVPEEPDVVFETEFDRLAAERTGGPHNIEVDQGAIPKPASEVDQSDMTQVEIGGVLMTASVAAVTVLVQTTPRAGDILEIAIDGDAMADPGIGIF